MGTNRVCHTQEFFFCNILWAGIINRNKLGWRGSDIFEHSILKYPWIFSSRWFSGTWNILWGQAAAAAGYSLRFFYIFFLYFWYYILIHSMGSGIFYGDKQGWRGWVFQEAMDHPQPLLLPDANQRTSYSLQLSQLLSSSLFSSPLSFSSQLFSSSLFSPSSILSFSSQFKIHYLLHL